MLGVSYLDNILIYSKNIEDHILHIRAVLKRLLGHQMYCNVDVGAILSQSYSAAIWVIGLGAVGHQVGTGKIVSLAPIMVWMDHQNLILIQQAKQLNPR